MITWKSQEQYFRSKDRAKEIIWCITTYAIAWTIHYVNLEPNSCLKVDFQKVGQHAGGKWLIHDTKRHKDNQLQSLKPPCSMFKLSS